MLKKIFSIIFFQLFFTAFFTQSSFAGKFKPLSEEISRGSIDSYFLMLRNASLNGNEKEAKKIANKLKHYSIKSYVEYYVLKSRLYARKHSEIRKFLNIYEGSAIADRLRNDWLILLGEQEKWEIFDKEYPLFILDDDSQVKCYSLLSKFCDLK